MLQRTWLSQRNQIQNEQMYIKVNPLPILKFTGFEVNISPINQKKSKICNVLTHLAFTISSSLPKRSVLTHPSWLFIGRKLSVVLRIYCLSSLDHQSLLEEKCVSNMRSCWGQTCERGSVYVQLPVKPLYFNQRPLFLCRAPWILA